MNLSFCVRWPQLIASGGKQAGAVFDRWCAFHEAVANLPDDEGDVFAPIFYHDLPQRDLAETLGVHPKTVQRRYRSACVRLYERLGGKLPEA